MTTSNLTEMHHRVREGLEKLAQLAHQQAEKPAEQPRHTVPPPPAPGPLQRGRQIPGRSRPPPGAGRLRRLAPAHPRAQAPQQQAHPPSPRFQPPPGHRAKETRPLPAPAAPRLRRRAAGSNKPHAAPGNRRVRALPTRPTQCPIHPEGGDPRHAQPQKTGRPRTPKPSAPSRSNRAHAAHEGPMQVQQGLIPPAAPKRPKPT